MPSSGTSILISGGVVTSSTGDGSAAQSGSGHIANIENRLGADLDPVLQQLADEIGKLTAKAKREELGTHLQPARAEAGKAKPDVGRIKRALDAVKSGAEGLEQGSKIIGFCNKAYNVVAPYLNLS